MALSPDTRLRFNPYLTTKLIRPRALRKEVEAFALAFQEKLSDQPEQAALVGRIGEVLDAMLSRQNSRTTPLHVRMVQGCVRVFMRNERDGSMGDFDFDLEVVNETARTVRQPKLQISR